MERLDLELDTGIGAWAVMNLTGDITSWSLSDRVAHTVKAGVRAALGGGRVAGGGRESGGLRTEERWATAKLGSMAVVCRENVLQYPAAVWACSGAAELSRNGWPYGYQAQDSRAPVFPAVHC